MAVRTYITETEFAKIDNPQSSTTYIVLDDNDPTLVKKVVFKTNNINKEGEVYIVQDEFPTPSGAVEITANGDNIDVKQYATANVNVPNPSTGTLNITSNATYDVKNYAFAEVDVPQPSGKITISQNGTDIDIAQYAYADVNVQPPVKTCSFKFNSDGQFQFIKNGYGSYYLKVNDGQWVEYDDTTTIDVYTNDVIELKSDVKHYSDKPTLSFNDDPNSTTAVSWELEGDIIGTLYDDEFPNYGCRLMFSECTGLTKVPNDMFANYVYTPFQGCYRMFAGCTSLTTAPALPATTLINSCYQGMFAGCTSLTTAPALPATTLINSCYSGMFEGCTSLTTAPALPVTTLAPYCYTSMFAGCTSLTTAPALPATTLAPYCYASMFNECTSLTTAPDLLATRLVSSCYANMFAGCTSLNYVKCLATNRQMSSVTSNWLDGVSATGTFVKYSLTEFWATGANGIPSGWTIQNEGPHNYRYDYLTFEATDSTSFTWTDSANNNSIEYSIDEGTTWTTLTSGSSTPEVNNGDKVIFRGSNLTIDNYNTGIGKFSSSGQFNVSGNIMSLIYGDNFINQTTLTGDGQFRSLFEGCTNLINTNNLILPATTLTDYCYCYSYMFNGCTSLTTAPALTARTLTIGCYSYMFNGCTSLTTAPELPAIYVTSDCYSYMFNGCTSLTTAPELPAKTLKSSCYMSMFEGCTSLTTAPELPAETLIYNCYYHMFNGCTSLNYVKCLATDNEDGTVSWLEGVAATGTFVKDANTTWPTGNSGIPSGWTIQDAA